MKKSLLLILSVFTISAKAQCPVTVNGQPTGGSFAICQGACITFTTSGAQTYQWLPAMSTSPTFSDCPSGTTTYTLITQSNGGACSDTNIFTVNVNPLPNVILSAYPFTICPGTTTTTIAATGAITYTWSPAASLSCSTCNNVVASPTSTTIYTVCGTDANGCSACSNISIAVSSSNPTVTTNNVGPICSGAVATLCAYGAQTYTWNSSPYLSCMTCACPVVSPTSSASYTVCGADAGGCVSCATVTVGVSPTPTVNFSLTNSSPQVWDAVVSYTGGTGAFTYSWNFGDGSTSTSAFPSHTYTAAGWYNVCVTVTDANGCVGTFCVNDSLYRSNSSMITLNVVNGSSEVAQHEKSNINFYPNPANEQLVINENVSVCEIYDISGKQVLSKNIHGKSILHISSLPEGIYLLRLKTMDSWSSKKLVIAR